MEWLIFKYGNIFFKYSCIPFEGACGRYASYLIFVLINGKEIYNLSKSIMLKDSNEILISNPKTIQFPNENTLVLIFDHPLNL